MSLCYTTSLNSLPIAVANRLPSIPDLVTPVPPFRPPSHGRPVHTNAPLRVWVYSAPVPVGQKRAQLAFQRTTAFKTQL